MLQHILKYRTNCEITTLYAGFDGMLLYMCRKLTVEKLNYALVGLLICWYICDAVEPLSGHEISGTPLFRTSVKRTSHFNGRIALLIDLII